MELDEEVGFAAGLDDGVVALLGLMGLIEVLEEVATELLLAGVVVTLDDEPAGLEEDLDDEAGIPAEAPAEVFVEAAFT